MLLKLAETQILTRRSQFMTIHQEALSRTTMTIADCRVEYNSLRQPAVSEYLLTGTIVQIKAAA